MQFYKEMRAVKEGLEVLGFDVLVPKDVYSGEVPVEARVDATQEEKITEKIEYDFIREHFRKIEDSDAILVLNFEKKGMPGYIGGNTFLEMGLAFWLGKKIYLLHSVPPMDYLTEMEAMQPTILHGDLSQIG